MPTYEGNAYTILEDLRDLLDEYSSEKVQGTDTTGRYRNGLLMRKVNQAGRLLFNLLSKRLPDEFSTSVELVGANSYFTLPWDFGSVIEFRDENGYKVWPITTKERKTANMTGSQRLYFREGNFLRVDKTGISATYTLYYKKKYRNIHYGQATAGAATSITLATDGSKVADYYNGLLIENITKDWVDTIDDYSAVRVATISETAAQDDWYGIVPDFPEMFHFLIAPRAAIDVRLGFPKTKMRPTTLEIKEFNSLLMETFGAYTGTSDDMGVDDIFTDFESNVPIISGIVSY